MGFAKHHLHLPLKTPSWSPPWNHRICCDVFMGLLIIFHVVFFITITLPCTTSVFPNRPISRLVSGEFNLTSLAADGFSGAWKLEFDVVNPPNGAFVSFVPTSVSVISAVDPDVIFAETRDIILSNGARNSIELELKKSRLSTPPRPPHTSPPLVTSEGDSNDVLQAHANAVLITPPNLHLNDAVLKKILADRVRGSTRFNVEISLKTEFIKRNIIIRSKNPISGTYRVKCNDIEFRFVSEDNSKFGIAKIAPVTCHVSSALDDILRKIVWPVI